MEWIFIKNKIRLYYNYIIDKIFINLKLFFIKYKNI